MKIFKCISNLGDIKTVTLHNNNYVELEGSIELGFSITERQVEIKKWLSPILPTNIFGIGFNYSDHLKETNFDSSKHPVVFLKATSSVNHPDSPIMIPKVQLKGPETDFEGELAVVIGKEAKNVKEDDALEYVFGYCCANDVSARRWQKHGGAGQWVRAKSFDTFCPLGPCIVTQDEIPNPQHLEIKTTLNGTILQKSNTQHMVYPVSKLIAYLSQDTTLLPGTVILTGTPEGVGFARNPRVFLNENDTVEVTIEKIGTLKNSVTTQ